MKDSTSARIPSSPVSFLYCDIHLVAVLYCVDKHVVNTCPVSQASPQCFERIQHHSEILIGLLIVLVTVTMTTAFSLFLPPESLQHVMAREVRSRSFIVVLACNYEYFFSSKVIELRLFNSDHDNQDTVPSLCVCTSLCFSQVSLPRDLHQMLRSAPLCQRNSFSV